jgi:nucleoredoxin|tara:strand:- start:593 stop:802 length:210 start_codon:yes stop_codon:yes gene_type:complete
VFVSSDRDQKSFDSYYAEMPFYALPFGARDEAASLGEKYGVKGIPTLVLLDGEGNLLNGSITGGHGQYL